MRAGRGLFQRGEKKTHWKRKTDSTFSGAKVSCVHRSMGEGRGRRGGTDGVKKEKDEDLRILVPFTAEMHSPLSLFGLTFTRFYVVMFKILLLKFQILWAQT